MVRVFILDIFINESGHLSAVWAWSSNYYNLRGCIYDNSLWHIVAVKYDQNGDCVSLYLDGSIVGTVNAGNLERWIQEILFSNGKVDGVKTHYNGLLDDVMIWDVALESVLIESNQ